MRYIMQKWINAIFYVKFEPLSVLIAHFDVLPDASDSGKS